MNMKRKLVISASIMFLFVVLTFILNDMSISAEQNCIVNFGVSRCSPDEAPTVAMQLSLFGLVISGLAALVASMLTLNYFIKFVKYKNKR